MSCVLDHPMLARAGISHCARTNQRGSQASGKVNTASLFVSFLYTAENVDNFCSISDLSLSFGSRNTFKSLEPSTLMRVRLP
mmetsp:Transcript_132175/g.242635  ORF Transcript_132175/g.242635 Transcript_132175/m.242635 type:complete len:82 (-) Transcript_132175:516-761(-)